MLGLPPPLWGLPGEGTKCEPIPESPAPRALPARSSSINNGRTLVSSKERRQGRTWAPVSSAPGSIRKKQPREAAPETRRAAESELSLSSRDRAVPASRATPAPGAGVGEAGRAGPAVLTPLAAGPPPGQAPPSQHPAPSTRRPATGNRRQSLSRKHEEVGRGRPRGGLPETRPCRPLLPSGTAGLRRG